MFKDVRRQMLNIWIKIEDQQLRQYAGKVDEVSCRSKNTDPLVISVNLDQDEFVPVYPLKASEGSNFEIAITRRRDQSRLRFQFRLSWKDPTGMWHKFKTFERITKGRLIES